jgi:hypothetical protein
MISRPVSSSAGRSSPPSPGKSPSAATSSPPASRPVPAPDVVVHPCTALTVAAVGKVARVPVVARPQRGAVAGTTACGYFTQRVTAPILELQFIRVSKEISVEVQLITTLRRFPKAHRVPGLCAAGIVAPVPAGGTVVVGLQRANGVLYSASLTSAGTDVPGLTGLTRTACTTLG